MAMDVYVGPLCRYFANDWLNEVAQMMPEKYVRMSPMGPIPREDPRKYHLAMLGYRKWVTPVFQKAGVTRLEWDERVNAPYFTQQLVWQQRDHVRLVAAYDEFRDFTPPETLQGQDMNAWFKQDVAWASAHAAGSSSVYAHLLTCEWWLPVEFPKPTPAPIPNQQIKPFGSVFALRRELEELAENVWTTPASELARRPLDETLPGETPLRHYAREGWSKLWQLSGDAVKHQLVMLLDY